VGMKGEDSEFTVNNVGIFWKKLGLNFHSYIIQIL
jgi:hypothetical protein